MDQLKLFDSAPLKQPVVLSYGMGQDSTALLVGLKRLNRRPDAILFADTGGEKPSTYDYFPIISGWLEANGFPRLTVVRYVPKKFKNWPPYYTLEDNCLTNGTLPSLAFGFKSCSLKWKVAPQNAWCAQWQPALDAWACGMKVLKMIGYDASPKDARRYAHNQHGTPDEKFEYTYPLMDWKWDRKKCAEVILDAGLPLPPKSSCFFCPAMQTHEVEELSVDYLRRIVTLEARAKPRLEKIEGLWRNGSSGKRNKTEPKPGSMTEFIRTKKLLPDAEIDQIIANVGKDIISFQHGFKAAKFEGTVDVFLAEHAEEDYRQNAGIPEEYLCCGG